MLCGISTTIILAKMNSRILKQTFMKNLAIFFGLTTVISGGTLLWTYTKNGKKWLENL